MAAITFRQLRYLQFNSLFLRRVLSLFYRDGKNYPVPFGPLKGLRLHYDQTINFHAILGLWDVEEYQFLERFFKEFGWLENNRVVADVGANIGFFSLWMSKQLSGTKHKIYAFEPAPVTQSVLKKNLALNGAGAIEVVNSACSSSKGSIDFFIGFHHHTSSLIQEWAKGEKENAPEKITVNTVTLDSFFEDRNSPYPDFIKMDIEGGGAFALKGVDHCLTKKRPLLWIESHTPEEDQAISDVLLKYDYQAYRFSNKKKVIDRDKVHPAPDGVWGTFLLYPTEQSNAVEKLL